jgi:regulator of protease activity HflC (stomatin/prohibitin superfamily)
VEILRADVKDLVFPGNLRQIMNQVLETARRTEARLVEANKSAEADLIPAQTENTKLTQKLEAEQKQSQILAATEREKLRIELEAEVAAAKATAENTAILELRRLEVLRELAGSGNGKFVIGLDAENTAKVVEESATRD